jgi:hypothetical protein
MGNDKHGHGRSNLEEKTFLELLQTTDRLSRGVAAVLKKDDLSPTQYTGHHPAARPHGKTQPDFEVPGGQRSQDGAHPHH